MEKLDPKAVWIFFFRYCGVGLTLGLVVFLIVFRFDFLSLGRLASFILIWLLGIYGWSKLSYNAYKFELAENAFKKEHGVVWKRYTSIPYEKIQNIDIHRGILARVLGLSDVMIQTAGYAGLVGYGLLGRGREPEGKIPGLSRERAEEISL